MKKSQYGMCLICICCLIGITACGFQLRKTTLHDTHVYLQFLHTDKLIKQVTQHLREEGAKIVPSMQQADYIMTLSKLVYNKRAASFSAVTGKTQEYEIHYSVLLKIADPTGDIIVAEQRIVEKRDYVFDENAIAAVSQEEIILQQDMLNQLAGSVTRQLMVIAN